MTECPDCKQLREKVAKLEEAIRERNDRAIAAKMPGEMYGGIALEWALGKMRALGLTGLGESSEGGDEE